MKRTVAKSPITSTKMKMSPIITPGSESGRMTSRNTL